MSATAAPGNTNASHSSLGEFIHATPEMPWLDDAACGSLPLEQLNMFFVEAGRTIASSTITMCQRCPVRAQCLDHAYSNEILSGYFGGISPGQRRTMTHEEARALIAPAR
jgi:hypothetical protein